MKLSPASTSSVESVPTSTTDAVTALAPVISVSAVLLRWIWVGASLAPSTVIVRVEATWAMPSVTRYSNTSCSVSEVVRSA